MASRQEKDQPFCPSSIWHWEKNVHWSPISRAPAALGSLLGKTLMGFLQLYSGLFLKAGEEGWFCFFVLLCSRSSANMTSWPQTRSLWRCCTWASWYPADSSPLLSTRDRRPQVSIWGVENGQEVSQAWKSTILGLESLLTVGSLGDLEQLLNLSAFTFFFSFVKWGPK